LLLLLSLSLLIILNQFDSNICSADGLLFGSICKHHLINCFTSSDLSFHSSVEKSNSAFLTLYNISWSVSPWNGGYPHNRIYNITPNDHISHLRSYCPDNTSGAIYYGVPALVVRISFWTLKFLANPKSINLISNEFLSIVIKFSGFKSLWTILHLWH